MMQSGILNIAEVLEQILHFLAIDKFLYSALFVSQLWYRCGAPILWRHIELKGITRGMAIILRIIFNWKNL